MIRRVVALAMLLVMISGCMPLGGELGASTALNMVPDPSYRAREGDRAYLYAVRDGSPLEQTPVLSDLTSYDKYERAIQADDPLELGNLEQQGWLQHAPLGAPIFIVRIHDRKHTGARVAAEIKFTDGPNKGKQVWTPLENIARLKRPDPAE
jgi:hypothetical protein